jgi:hypothetical protein
LSVGVWVCSRCSSRIRLFLLFQSLLPFGSHLCLSTLSLALSASLCRYVFGALLMQRASANFQGLVVAMANPLAVVFWFVAPTVNAWQCGAPYGVRDIAFSCSALLPLVAGVYLFRRFEKDKMVEKQERDDREEGRDKKRVAAAEGRLA